MKNLLLQSWIGFIGLMLIQGVPVAARQYTTERAEASFEVTAPAKKINGHSNQVKVQIDTKTGSVLLQVAVSSFSFHNNFVNDTLNEVIGKRFNSYYMESRLYPDISFRGTLLHPESIRYEKNGRYSIKAQGGLVIHGWQQTVTTDGWITVKDGEVTVDASITVLPADYHIRIPAYIGNMYFKEVTIKVHAVMNTGAGTAAGGANRKK